MKNFTYSIVFSILSIINIELVCAQSGGSLIPPAGAPTRTMKSLDEVEARTAISSLPFTITESGSYYLTGNLTSSADGIRITVSDVTLDLNGFTIKGSSGISNNEGVEVKAGSSSLLSNIVIKNGTINGFGESVELNRVNSSSLYDLHCVGAGGRGIYLNATNGKECNGNTIKHCKISGSGSYGVYLNGTGGKCNGNKVINCTVMNSGNSGIFLHGSSGECSGNFVEKVIIFGAVEIGMNLAGSDSNRIESNHISGVTSSGGTSVGIKSSSSDKNLILKNSCIGQDDNFSIDFGNVYGPEVTTLGAMSTTGAASHPWANFSL